MGAYETLLASMYQKDPRHFANVPYMLKTQDEEDEQLAASRGPNTIVGAGQTGAQGLQRPSMAALTAPMDPTRSTADDLAGMPSGSHVGGPDPNASLDRTMSPEGAAARRSSIASSAAETAAATGRDITQKARDQAQANEFEDIGREIPQLRANVAEDVKDVAASRDTRRYFEQEQERRRRFELSDAMQQLAARYSDPAWAHYQASVDTARERAAGQVDAAGVRGKYGLAREGVHNQGLETVNEGRNAAAAITATGRQGGDVTPYLPQPAGAGKTFTLLDVKRIATEQGKPPYDVFQSFQDNGYKFAPDTTPGVGAR